MDNHYDYKTLVIQSALRQALGACNFPVEKFQMLMEEISKLNITSFYSDVALTKLHDLVYGDDQDYILDFISLILISLDGKEFTAEMVKKVADNHIDSVKEKMGFPSEFSAALISSTITNNLLFSTLFLIRVYSSYIISNINLIQK